MRNTWHSMALAGLVLALAPLGVRADTVWIGGAGGTRPVETRNVKIKTIQGGELYYDLGGREIRRDVASVARIQIDGETALNAAEEAYAREDWASAVDGYLRVSRGTGRPWLAQWAATRLVASANKAGRLDAAVSGYLALVMVDPELAARYKPTIPEKSTFLNTAVKEVEARLNEARREDQRRSMLGFLLELHSARGDTKKSHEVAMELGKMGALPPQAQAVLKLGLASEAMQKKDYAQVIAQIESDKTVFVEPQHQADALFMLAEAKAQLAGSDEAALKDAALAYMRVVAHFGSVEGRPHVAMSLLRTGDIYQQLKEPQTAMRIYQRVAEEFAGDPAGREARRKADALKESQEQS